MLYVHFRKISGNWNVRTEKRIFQSTVLLELAGGGGGAVYPHILAIRVCAAGEGMVFKPFSLV